VRSRRATAFALLAALSAAFEHARVRRFSGVGGACSRGEAGIPLIDTDTLALDDQRARGPASADACFALAKEASRHALIALANLVHCDRLPLDWPDARKHAESGRLGPTAAPDSDRGHHDFQSCCGAP
jgi:hypothetical protein